MFTFELRANDVPVTTGTSGTTVVFQYRLVAGILNLREKKEL